MPPAIGRLYAKLYRRINMGTFTSSDLVDLAGGRVAARVAVKRMRKAGAAYLHEKTPRRWIYRLADPETYILSVSGAIRNLEKIPQQRYSRLLGIFCAELIRRSLGIKSVVLFGSVARGKARQDSDVDLLIVTDKYKSAGEAIDRLVEVEYSDKVAQELAWLEENGIPTHISFHPMTSETLRKHPPLLLDIVDEGIILIDDGTYAKEAKKIKAKMRELGSKRIWLNDDEWVWVLKPYVKLGEVIEL